MTASSPDSNGYIPAAQWGKDHWSTLAYVESVMVECGGFQIGQDPRMKSNRRHSRVMAEQCRHPKRPGKATSAPAIVMNPEHATRLKDGAPVANHDDWCCLQDFAAEGLFTVWPHGVEPTNILALSVKGQAWAAALRQHKQTGGSFSGFNAPTQAEPEDVSKAARPR